VPARSAIYFSERAWVAVPENREKNAGREPFAGNMPPQKSVTY
jgi:hypothetical protein